MILYKLDTASLAFGDNYLLDDVNFQVEDKERICIIGRNGVGKSSLLNVIASKQAVDSGQVWRRDNLRVSYLEQDNQEHFGDTVYTVVASGLPETGKLLAKYHQVSHDLAVSTDSDNALMAELGKLQQQLEHCDGWNLDQKIEAICSRLDVPIDDVFDDLSGGTRRRVLLAKALASDPELLILDEPTNHLDIERIQWLEDYLLNFEGAMVFVTHDRSFLQNLATRIVELDRGRLTSYPGDYQKYVSAKLKALDEEQVTNAKFDKKLAEEERWIRQGIKARRTRNEGRVSALKAMRQERSLRREKLGNMKITVDAEKQSGKLVLAIEDLCFSFPGSENIIDHFSAQVVRKDRIGIIGPNGCGKSTLIKLLLDQLQPVSGTITRGTKLDVLYFDQQRSQLEPDKTVIENLGMGSDSVTLGGRTRHAVGYLQDFMFPPQRIHSPVRALSGGEQNRLLLARLFTKPDNFLILDEPTNDLDVESLELLEDLVGNFEGTIILVSHDRAFLDNIVTSTWVFEGDGVINEYVGGYSDWQRQSKQRLTPVAKPKPEQAQMTRSSSVTDSTQKNKPSADSGSKKLSYKESRELEQLPKDIESMESEKESIEAEMSQADFYKQDDGLIKEKLQRLDEISDSLVTAYARWEDLENRA
jgi:ATP-binding cassette subfamily F protein uup